MFNFLKGTYVIKTVCNWLQKWTWVILPDADITVASLNSLRDLALDFIIVIFLFFCQETKILKVREVRALCEKNTNMTDSDRIKIAKYICETQMSLMTPCKTCPVQIGLMNQWAGLNRQLCRSRCWSSSAEALATFTWTLFASIGIN